MAKLPLLNTVTNTVHHFEPIDAREILAAENTIYKMHKVEPVAADAAKAAVSTSGGSLEGDAVDTSAWTKAQMIEHLTQKGVPLRSDMSKAELTALMETNPVKAETKKESW